MIHKGEFHALIYQGYFSVTYSHCYIAKKGILEDACLKMRGFYGPQSILTLKSVHCIASLGLKLLFTRFCQVGTSTAIDLVYSSISVGE